MFGSGVNLIHTAKIHHDSCKLRDLWVTDFVIMPNVNKIAVAFTTKEIGINRFVKVLKSFNNAFKITKEFYDCSKFDFNCQLRINNLTSTALCIDYWYGLYKHMLSNASIVNI